MLRHKIAALPDLKRALGTSTELTVFRKLKQLHYLSSYTHRGSFYTLPGIARFNAKGLWSFRDVWFSRHGTLLATAEAFVRQSPRGYFADELAAALHTEVQDSLRILLQRRLLHPLRVGWLVPLHQSRADHPSSADPGAPGCPAGSRSRRPLDPPVLCQTTAGGHRCSRPPRRTTTSPLRWPRIAPPGTRRRFPAGHIARPRCAYCRPRPPPVTGAAGPLRTRPSARRWT